MSGQHVNETCALCPSVLNNKNQSKEHIIPNSIGGRRKTRTFICNTCNNRLGQTWDAELARQLNWCGLTAGISRERGEVPKQIVQTVEGTRLWLHNDGTMTPEHPARREQVVMGTTEISIMARNMAEAKRMLNDAKRQHPALDKEKAQRELEIKQEYLGSPIHVSLGLGGPEAGRSIVKTAFSHASDSGVPHQLCNEALNYLTNNGCLPPYGFAYLSDLVKNRPADKVFHCVSLMGDPRRGRLISYIEYFGLFRLLVNLSGNYTGTRIHETYAIDPTNGGVLNIEIDWSIGEKEIKSILDGQGYSDEIYRAAADYAMPLLLRRNDDRHTGRAIREAFDHAAQSLGIKEDELIPPEKSRLLVDLMMEHLTPFIHHLVMRNRPRGEQQAALMANSERGPS